MKKVVVFDLDDTLVPNAIYYSKAKTKTFEMFKSLFSIGISNEEFLKDFSNIDMEKVKKLGLSRARFPLTAVQLYMSYCERFGHNIACGEIDEVFTAANTVFDIVEELSSEAINMIKSLISSGYEVCLLTSGDEVVQAFKVFKSKLHQLIPHENIIIVPEKNDEIYPKYFSKYGVENCCMIGNSRKGDINPAINAGMFAIYIPADTWEYEVATLKESEKLYVLHSLSDVPSALKQIYEGK